MRLVDADKIPWDVEGVGTIPVVTKDEIDKMPAVDAVPIDWIEEWCLSQDLEYVRIAIKKMIDNLMAERKEK